MGDSLVEYQGDFTKYPNPPYPGGGTVSVTLYRLDREGRPVSYTYSDRYQTGSGTIEYDRAGNRVIPGVTYDNKVNVYQTNKIWQQAFGDYSRNNPYPAGISAYNNYGLPVEYLSTPSLYVSTFGFPPTNYLIRLTYSCDSTKLAH